MTNNSEIELKILSQHLRNQKIYCLVKYIFHEQLPTALTNGKENPIFRQNGLILT